MNKCRAISAKDIYELEDQINEFSKQAKVFSTQIFLNNAVYDCLIWYEENKIEPIIEKKEVKEVKSVNLATDKQKSTLKRFGIPFDDSLTRKEAFEILKEKFASMEKQ